MKSIFYVCDRCGKPAAAVSVMKISLHMQKGSSPAEAKEYDFCPSCFTVIQNAFLDVLKYKNTIDARPSVSVPAGPLKPDNDKRAKTALPKLIDAPCLEEENAPSLVRGPITKQQKQEILRLFVENGLSPEQIAGKIRRLPNAVSRVIQFASKTGELGKLYDKFLVSEPTDADKPVLAGKTEPDTGGTGNAMQPDAVDAGHDVEMPSAKPVGRPGNLPGVSDTVVRHTEPALGIPVCGQSEQAEGKPVPDIDVKAAVGQSKAQAPVEEKDLKVKVSIQDQPETGAFIKKEKQPAQNIPAKGTRVSVKKEKPVQDILIRDPDGQPKANRLGRDIGSGITNGGILKDGYVSPPKIQVIGGKRYDIGCILALARAGWPVDKIADEKQYDTGIVKAVMKKYL